MRMKLFPTTRDDWQHLSRLWPDNIPGAEDSAADNLRPQSAPMTQAIVDSFDRQRFKMAAWFAQANPPEDDIAHLKFLPDEVI